MSSASIVVMLNGELGRWIKCKQGLRQGDPLSPPLFILAVDILAQILKRANDLSQIEGIDLQKEFNDIFNLQFADNILLFCAT